MSSRPRPSRNWTTASTQRLSAGGIDFVYRELGTENPGPRKPDAGHGAPFQCHEQFVPQALAFLAR